MTGSDQHRKRMKALAAFSASSPTSPGRLAPQSTTNVAGVLVAEAYDGVIKMCDPTNQPGINAIRDSARELRWLSLTPPRVM